MRESPHKSGGTRVGESRWEWDCPTGSRAGEGGEVGKGLFTKTSARPRSMFLLYRINLGRTFCLAAHFRFTKRKPVRLPDVCLGPARARVGPVPNLGGAFIK
jgi:hypothetical protein